MNARQETASGDKNPVFGFERRGFEFIPSTERNMTLRQVDMFWLGTSANLLSFVLGALTIGLGCPLWLALVACVIGNLAYAYPALGSIWTVRAGLPVTMIGRAAFGVRGNMPNAFLAWLCSVAFEIINTIFGVYALLAIFKLLGWAEAGSSGKLVAVLLQLALCGGIAMLGHATMVWFQRIFAVLVSAALVLVALHSVGLIDWTNLALPTQPMSGTTLFGTLFAATAIVASNPVSFLFNGPDWVRYLPTDTPAKSIFFHVFWASYVPSVALGMLGAGCATLGDLSDPVHGMAPFLPQWLFTVYAVAVVGGSVANTIPTYYSSGLSLQALGLRVSRYMATVVDVVIATAITLYILFVQDFSVDLPPSSGPC